VDLAINYIEVISVCHENAKIGSLCTVVGLQNISYCC
jgi:hypothetical protein